MSAMTGALTFHEEDERRERPRPHRPRTPSTGPPDERRPPLWQRLLAGSSTPIGLILVALIVVFSVLEFETFFAVANARNIATDAAVLLVLAVGSTYVIITAGIDLSVGAVLVFSGVVAAKVMNEVGGRGWGVILLGLVAVAGPRAWRGAAQRLPDRQGEDPAVHRHARHARHVAGLRLLITGGVDEREVPFKLVDTIGIGRVFGRSPTSC